LISLVVNAIRRAAGAIFPLSRRPIYWWAALGGIVAAVVAVLQLFGGRPFRLPFLHEGVEPRPAGVDSPRVQPQALFGPEWISRDEAVLVLNGHMTITYLGVFRDTVETHEPDKARLVISSPQVFYVKTAGSNGLWHGEYNSWYMPAPRGGFQEVDHPSVGKFTIWALDFDTEKAKVVMR
jgi:hypothetical protein